jgi:DNA-binding response OmpR family regulator
MELLLASFGTVVPSAELNEALWPDRDPDYEPRTIHVVIHRLRKQISPLGYAIATIRAHGFLLHHAEA